MMIAVVILKKAEQNRSASDMRKQYGEKRSRKALGEFLGEAMSRVGYVQQHPAGGNLRRLAASVASAATHPRAMAMPGLSGYMPAIPALNSGQLAFPVSSTPRVSPSVRQIVVRRRIIELSRLLEPGFQQLLAAGGREDVEGELRSR